MDVKKKDEKNKCEGAGNEMVWTCAELWVHQEQTAGGLAAR